MPETAEAEYALGPAAPAPVAVPLPPWLAQKLIALGLRTEVGREVWETYALDRLEQAPWLAAGVRFLPGPGEIVPAPPAAETNGRA